MSRPRSATRSDPANDLLKLRKQLIQSQSVIGDLKDELEEKTSLYMRAIKERDAYKEKLDNAKDNINRVQDIVQQKVDLAMEKEHQELARLTEENRRLIDKISILDGSKKQLEEDKRQLLDKVHGLTDSLAFYTKNSGNSDALRHVDQLLAEKDTKDKKITELLHEINSLSNLVEDFIAENRALRQMANVPDNYGIKLDQIKLHDKEKVDDFKKLIKVLQDDNYKLEEERAKLKHALKIQSMMYKSTDPTERFKGLTQEQLLSVDQYVLRLLQGDLSDPADYYQVKKENEMLKAQIEAMNTRGFEIIAQQVKGMFKDGNFGGDSSQLSKLIQDNEELRMMIARLLEQGISTGGGGNTTPMPMMMSYGKYRPPMPHPGFDGEINNGTSFKFDNSNLHVVDRNGNPGVNATNLYEHAFLQLQLQECLEIIRRKDESLNSQSMEIESLYNRIRSYLLTQDQLYKDYIRIERHLKRTEENYAVRLRKAEDQVMEETSRCQKLEEALKAIQTKQSDSLQNRIIELTKQNSILDINLLRLTRKYTTLEEQEKLLRREYHNKDEDMAEKDRFVQARINNLKQWKARAMQQLKFLFEKLRMAVPMSEYQCLKNQLEVAEQRKNDYVMRNASLAKQLSNYQEELRKNQEAEESLKYMQEMKDDCEAELEIVKKRLEHFDPVFRFENQVFTKIAMVLKRAKVSPQQAFEEFDTSKDGNLQRDEFVKALDMLRVYDLTERELDVLWKSLDVDRSNSISIREFCRKLERYGVANRSREEHIIYQMIEAVQRSNVKSMSNLFELIDKNGRGFISRDDFTDIFKSLSLKIDQSELNKFCDHFWQDKDAGIDYQGFLRIFSRYQVRFAQEQASKKGPRAAIPEKTIRLKKDIYMRINSVLEQSGKTMRDLFRRVDNDASYEIDQAELWSMFQGMKLNEVSKSDCNQIFLSIDFDESGSVSLPEMISDFKTVVASDVEDLVREERQRAQLQSTVQSGNEMVHGAYGVGAGSMTGAQHQEIQLQTRIDILQAREKQLQKKLETNLRILHNAEKSLAYQQRQYDNLEKSWDTLTVNNYELKDRIVFLENEAKNSIKKDDAMQLATMNEKLLTDLTETRAAMLSYKNMTMVIADQVKNIKLMHERKRDEQENLLGALREMQSDGVTQERLGKLYFIIMLSRWQEASVNKKYEMILQETKALRTDQLNMQQSSLEKDKQINNLESTIQQLNLNTEKLRQQVNASKGEFLSQNRVVEFNTIIQDLSDSKTDLEEAHMKLRTNYRVAQDLLDTAQAKADHSAKMLEQLQGSRPSEITDRLVEMSESLQSIRLESYRAKRECEELNEKCNYLSKLLKGKNDTCIVLEEKAAKCESAMYKAEEEFRRRDNERQKQFFYRGSKFDDAFDSNNQNVGRNIAQATSLTDTTIRHVDGNPMQAAAIQQSLKSHQRIDNVQAAWTQGQNMQPAHDPAMEQRLKQLEGQIRQLTLENSQKQGMLDRFEQWQLGDKYLTKDEVLKDAIAEHRAATAAAQENDNKEMADAAYQTVKTLQDMLDQKNELLRGKEQHIENLRQQMMQQREQDALEISKLREQLSITGNNTLSKLHQIVAKQGGDVTSHKAAISKNKADRMDKDELMRALQEKDRIISKLEGERNGWMKERTHFSGKKNENLDKIQRLEEELRRERSRTDIKAAHTKLQRLQKERHEQDAMIKNLNKAIDNFKDRMILYENEKIGLSDNSALAKKNQELAVTQAKQEKEALSNKLKLVESSRDKKNQECTALKVQLSEAETELARVKTSKDEMYQKYQQALGNLDKERREKARLTAELQNYKNENKIGGNVGGGMSYDALVARNKELEQDNTILNCQKQTVVVYNKQFGTFEYIGQPRPLSTMGLMTHVRQIFDEMEKWLKTNDRITVRGIFNSLDKGCFGELTPAQVSKAFEKIGVTLQPQELNLLKDKLDPKNIGYLKTEPLIRQLSGIPCQEFLNLKIVKVAHLVDARDLTQQQFRQQIDPTHMEQVDLATFKKNMSALNREDFMLDEPSCEEIFKEVTRQTKVQVGVKLSITVFVDQVFYALQAVAVERMRETIRRCGKPLTDLMDAFDNNKDGFLEYNEIQNMLLECKCNFGNHTFQDILISQILDPAKRRSKVSFDALRFYIGDFAAEQGAVHSVADLLPSQDSAKDAEAAAKRGALTPVQYEAARSAARKVLIACGTGLVESLTNLDKHSEGLVATQEIERLLTERKISELNPSELKFLIQICDQGGSGYAVISKFNAKLQELASETDAEVKLRRFAKTIGHQGLNLKSELNKYDTSRHGRMDQVLFKRALKQLAIAMSDAEINSLFEGYSYVAGPQGKKEIDIVKFCQQVQKAALAKPLPQFVTQAPQPGLKVQTRIGTGSTNATASTTGFENWEIEKKYKKNLEALKQEIEERNREIQIAKKEAMDVNRRAQDLEEKNRKLEARLVDKHAKPPGQIAVESTNQGALDELQKLRDDIFHLQNVNQGLEKVIQVDLKAELSRKTEEKEWLEEKLKQTADRLRNKTAEVNQLIGKPMDNLTRREEGEHSRQKQIDELLAQQAMDEACRKDLMEQLFKAQEKILDLKFEKETFDLQYVRLQKRITDLEQYKLKSSQLSAVMKQQQQDELAEIRDTASKMTGEVLTAKQGDTVKLRKRTSKSQAELEAVIESLRRVIDKQKVENDALKRQNDRLEKINQKGNNEPALRQKIEQLELVLHSYEMKEVNLTEQDTTIKKLIFANKKLREDLQKEIERYNLLEAKFRDILVKYNVVARENEKNKELVFTQATGGHLNKYEEFLDDQGDPVNKHQSGFSDRKYKPEKDNSDTFGRGLDDSLNAHLD